MFVYAAFSIIQRMPLAGLKALSAELVGAKWIETKKGSELMANQMNALGLRYDPT